MDRTPDEPPIETTTVAAVHDGSITMATGWSVGIPEDVTPAVGDVVMLWGKGIGYVNRGLCIGGTMVYYRTEVEQEVEDLLARIQHDEDKRVAFAKAEAKLDNQYNNLPAPFRERIDRFRLGNPDFRWKFEAYEMSCCVDAVRIASAARAELPDDPAAWIDDFSTLKFAEQNAFVADLFGGHSGNSFGCAISLAKIWIEHPELVPKLHGALVPLVGCDEYGCTHNK